MFDWLKRKTTVPVGTGRSAVAALGAVRADAGARAPAALPQTPAPMAGAVPAVAISTATFLSWLLDEAGGAAPTAPRDVSVPELEALASIDALISGRQRADQLLPRAPAVIPQLLSALRQSNSSVPALVERISKDLVLAAEVMRMARSVAYSRDGEVHDLSRAVASLGEQGLQRAISRVVLRPLMQAGGGNLSGVAAARLWEHTEYKADLCGAKCAGLGLDAFDGYLAGMLHSAGWSGLLRQLDLRTPPPRPWSGAFIDALAARRDPLFGRVVGGWAVSPAITVLAAEALSPGLTRGHSPLARLLLESDREATATIVGQAMKADAPEDEAPPGFAATAFADTLL
jgi:hypothetical protein